MTGVLVGNLTYTVLNTFGLGAKLEAFLRGIVVGFADNGSIIGSGLFIQDQNEMAILTVGHIGLASPVSAGRISLISSAFPPSHFQLNRGTRIEEVYKPSGPQYEDAAVLWLDPRDAATIRSWGGRGVPLSDQGKPWPDLPDSAYLVSGFPNSLGDTTTEPDARRVSRTFVRLDLWADRHAEQRGDGTVSLDLSDRSNNGPLSLPGMSGAPVWKGWIEPENRVIQLRAVGFHSGSNADVAVFVPSTQALSMFRAGLGAGG